MSAFRQYDLAFNALGDPTRRAIFEKLEKGPLSVVHIAEGLSVTRPAVSQHLKVLLGANLISMAPSGTRSIYSVNQEGLRAIRDYLDRFWGEALDNFKKLAEQAEKQKLRNNGNNELNND
jgi:DNA-binding transcriptional ArsR family regulator